MECRLLRNEEFPTGLLHIPEPPEELYVRGSLPEKGTKFLGVVGSRAFSPYGKEACETLIAGLRGYPISIVSGLALGIDAIAHTAAVANGLHTVAVLPSSVDDASIYPTTNAELAKNILIHGGLLMSEHKEGYRPQKFDFPKRNRIVVGLSHAVLIIEAEEKSGTLITARLSGDYNRELLVVPHRIGDSHAAAAYTFLRLGATLVADASHILEALDLQ